MNLYRHPVLAWLAYRVLFRNPGLRLAVTKLLVRPRERHVDLLGARLLIHSLREIGYWRAAKAQQAAVVLRDEVPSLLALCGLCGPGTTFVDAGANVGLFTAVIAPLRQVHAGLTLHAIEPNPDTARRLRQNVGSAATVHALALSDRDGEIEMHFGAVSGVFGADRGPAHTGAPPLTVPCRRLDSLGITGDRILLKIDVEDHEVEVLAGAVGLLGSGRVAAVFIDGARDRAAVVRVLEGHGFRVLDGHGLGPLTADSHKLLALARTSADGASGR